MPKATELWNEGRVGHDVPVELEPNQVAGPYSSIDDYLERHYMLLREDAVRIFSLQNSALLVLLFGYKLHSGSLRRRYCL